MYKREKERTVYNGGGKWDASTKGEEGIKKRTMTERFSDGASNREN